MNLTDIPRRAPEVVLAGLRDTNPGVSRDAAAKLVSQAKESGLSMANYLMLAINPAASATAAKYAGLNGLEAAFMELQLPFRDDLEQGVLLQAAADTFQKFPGTRAMFPEVIDQMVRWRNRQDQIETVAPMIAQSRTIAGTELISTVIDDDAEARRTSSISELGNIPVRTIKSSQTSVAIYKHGSGIRTSYEFERRVSLDIMTPFAARIGRELEISKVRAATSVLVNGDGVNAAAGTKAFTSFQGIVPAGTANPISGQYKALARWLVSRAKAGLPIDTLVGNIDMYLELLFMFTPSLSAAKSEADALAEKGAPRINVNLPMLGGNCNFVLSSTMPANKLLGYSKSDTLEELTEAGSAISENERSILNQSITYVKTENSGYKLAFGDTREILDFSA
jgi:hypothetical protein